MSKPPSDDQKPSDPNQPDYEQQLRDAAKKFTEAMSAQVKQSWAKLKSDLSRDTAKAAASAQDLVRTLSKKFEPAGVTLGSAPRTARLVREATRVATAYRVHAMREAALGKKLPQERDKLHESAAERLYNLCVDMRGAVLKIGQAASSRSDLLPAPYIDSLSRLQDQVPPLDTDKITERIEQDLGAPIDQLFAEFEDQPVAAASLAQVHGAVMADGQRVAVKVLVPGVEEQVKADLAAFEIIANMAKSLSPRWDIRTWVAELARAIKHELDYKREADLAGKLIQDMAEVDGVVVPRIVPERSGDKVLTMERLDGERLSEFLDQCNQRGDQGRADRDKVLSTLMRAYAAMVFRHGRFQADPHPGNFLVLPGPKLALLDFGSVAELEPDERSGYARLVMAVMARDQKQAIALLRELGFAIPTASPSDEAATGSSEQTTSADEQSRDSQAPESQALSEDDILNSLAELLLDAFRPSPDKPISNIDPRAAFEEVLAVARTHPITVPEHFVLIGRAMSSLAGLLLTHRPSIDLFQEIAPYLTGRA